MTRRIVLLGLGALLLAGRAPARAQGGPRRIRGRIEGLADRLLTVTTREGQTVAIRLSEGVGVSALRRLELSAIAPGTFIGTAAEPGPDGVWRAMEVLVFPEAMRGTGEGHYAWDLTPSSSMTNATVDSAVQGNDGRSLTLTARGQTVKVLVPPEVPVVTPIPAAMEDLRPGAQVFLSARPGPDGVLTATRVTVARDGVVPPM
ncbi:hypothetical protein SAMN02745194_03029 [Roseomonas rosea]|uniref:DUF5666 domain-containing protein n=1 Tax=Muricoccus roseus TaxID=198092 RepID=A0A1M6KYQ0_9PROT|nr:DUF5666 domain-containing protein [Roseomonas rosea]SHJ64131.1 hypothetical protein SAMN02745194_03029 [Roseomonas rosea]